MHHRLQHPPSLGCSGPPAFRSLSSLCESTCNLTIFCIFPWMEIPPVLDRGQQDVRLRLSLSPFLSHGGRCQHQIICQELADTEGNVCVPRKTVPSSQTADLFNQRTANAVQKKQSLVLCRLIHF